MVDGPPFYSFKNEKCYGTIATDRTGVKNKKEI